MTSLDIQFIKNARQQYKAQLHLDQVLKESKHFIKKALYKKAFQLVDRFLLQYNTKNQLNVETRITLRRRSIYTLSRILFKMAIKNAHGLVKIPLYEQDKFQIVVNRISTLLDEQYLDIHLLVQNTSHVVQNIMDLQNTESLTPSEFQLKSDCKVHLTREIKGFLTQIIRIMRNIGLYYRCIQDVRGAHYIAQSEQFSRTLLNQTDKFEGMWDIIMESQKSQLALNSIMFEWGWIDKIHSDSFYLEHQLILIMNMYQIHPDPKLRYRLKRIIKILSMTLLFQNYVLMEEGKIDEAHEILLLIEWILQSYIPINQDDLKHHIINQIRLLQPRYQEYLLAKHELAIIFMDYFGSDHWIYQKQTETKRNIAEATTYRKGLQHHFNSICHKKYSVDNIQQIYVREKPVPKLKLDFQSSNKKTALSQHETFHDHTTLDQLSSQDMRRTSNHNQQQLLQPSLSTSVMKSDRPRTSSTTKQIDYNFDNLPKTAREHINFDFRIQNRNLEIKSPEGRLDIDLDRILKKEVFKSLMKQDQSKHSSLVQEQFQEFLRQNAHDIKNVDFEQKMLSFKRYTNQLLSPPKEVLTRQALRLNLFQQATVQAHVNKVKIKADTHNDVSSEESLLSFEKPGKTLTPGQKFRKILFKHKAVFKLDNLRAKLKARQKEKKLAQIAKANHRRSVGMNTHIEKKKVDEAEVIQKTFKKSKELFLTYLKAVENEKARLDEEVISPKFLIRGKPKCARSNSKEEKNIELRKKFNDLFESTKNQGAAKASSGSSLADLIKVSVARIKLKKF